jgi:23S rRNA (pseudouridine1915-N3)-methyltransferase
MRIRLIWEGKTRNAQLRELQEDYAARVRHFADLRIEEVRAARDRSTAKSLHGVERIPAAERQLLEKLAGSYKVFLDVRGRHWSSEEFAAWMGERALRGTRELAFLVGAPEGFSSAFKKRSDLLLALSRMTLTRDWARVLLLEQIYRGFTILQGYPYAK